MNRLTNTQFTTLNEAWQTIRDIKEAAIEYPVRTLADDALNQLWALARQLGSTLPAAEPERTWTFTISANFTAPTEQDARDEWYDWLNSFNHVAEGTQVTENLPDEYDDGTPSVHLQGTEGQDRESYTDTQDRDEYTIALETPDERHLRLANEARAKSGLAPLTPQQAEAFLRSVRSFRRVSQ